MPKNREQRRKEQKEARRKGRKENAACTGSKADPLAAAGLTVTDAPQPVDLTKDGACSRCGGCCGSVLSVTVKELRALQEWAGKTGFEPRPLIGDDVADMQCPFLIRQEGGATRCACYGARPAVCRAFDCRNTNEQNALEWLEASPEKGQDGELPKPRNVWQVFGLTGLKSGGRDVPYHGGPRCRVKNDEGDTYEFFVGRPVSLVLTDGTDLPWSMVIAIYRDGLQVFSSLSHELEFVPYGKMAAVASDNRVETIEDGKPLSGAGDVGAIKDAIGHMAEGGDGTC